MDKLSQRGVAHILLLLILFAGLAVGVYLITQGPLKLFSKASNPPVVFKDSSGTVITKTTSPTVKIEFTSPLGPAGNSPANNIDKSVLGTEAASQTFNIGYGNNLIGLIIDKGVSFTAEDFLKELNAAASNKITYIYKTDPTTGKNITHNPGTAVDNFAIKPGEAYFVVSKNWKGSITIKGTKPDIYSLTIPKGSSLITFPQVKSSINKAESLLQDMKKQGLNVSTISKFQAGGYQSHPVGYPFNNFAIVPSEGYSVKNLGETKTYTFADAPANPSPTPGTAPSACTACSADADKSGFVNTGDFSLIKACQLKPVTGACANADVNGDKQINGEDITCWQAHLGKQCSLPSPSPAPAVFTCTACAADINKDGWVNILDFSKLSGCYFKDATGNCAAADINPDGKVNAKDYACLVSQYNKKCETTGTPVPAPSPIATPTPVAVTTSFYRYGESPAELDSATYIPYTATPMVIDYTFKDTAPGQKFIWVDFKDSTGKVERRSVQLVIAKSTVEAPAPVALTGLKKAAKITADGNGITIPGRNIANNQEFTVEGWFKWNGEKITAPSLYGGDVGLDQYLIAKWQSQSAPYNASYDLVFTNDNTTGSEFIGRVLQNAEILRVANPFADKKWHHVALVRYAQPIKSGENYPRNETHLYIDGQLQKSTWTYGPVDFGDGDLYIGWLASKRLNKPLSFLGEIDEVRLSKIARYKEKFYPVAAPFTTDSNTVGLWHFDGDAQDSSGNNYHGQSTKDIQYVDSTVQPFFQYQSPILPKPGFGNAVLFLENGAIQVTQPYKVDKFDDLTLDAWVMLRNIVRVAPIISENAYSLAITPDRKLKFTYSILLQGRWAPTEFISDATIEEGKWTHVAVVYNNVPLSKDQGKISLYINGQRVGQKYESGPIGGGSDGRYVFIGRDPNSLYTFSGAIDEIRISKSPKYIGDNITVSSPFGADVSTLLLCHFDENEGNPVCTNNDNTAIQTNAFNVNFLKNPQ